MQKSSKAEARRSLQVSLVVLGLVAALVILPYHFRSEAGSQKGGGLFTRTVSHDPEIPNYDVREDKESAEYLAGVRDANGKTASLVADVRDEFVRGEERLRTKVPSLKVDYNTDIRIPEVIAPDVKQGPNFMTPPSGAKRSDILRNFIKENDSLVGVSGSQADSLKVTIDERNPDGNLGWAQLDQEINGIPVFRGYVRAGFDKQNQLFRVINNLAPGLDYESLSKDFNNPLDAVRSAATSIKHDMRAEDSAFNDKASTDKKAVFGEGDWATTAEKIYFPTEPGVAIPAWRVLIWQPVNAYYVIVDANSGKMLWRKNLTEDQAQTSTFQVYANPNAQINVADNPAPLSPYISANTAPADGAQGAIATRSNVTLIGNEAPNTFNTNGWITDGANTTDGNAVEAGLDLSSPDGIDAGTQATGSPNRTFTSLWNPPPGNPAPGDAPTAAEARRGAVIQMFYAMNLYHDYLYRLGFTEQFNNYQANNFGRGGTGNDRVSAEGQDSSGTDNANFSAGTDGTRGKMQMFLWTGPSPQRDGTGDQEVIFHEVTHGTSNRLHGNSSGLSTNMSRAMGEGWGDFFAHAMLSQPTDPLMGCYALGGYALLNGFGVVGTGNYYYGIRRFPKCVMAFTGGPNNRSHNPLTFADVDSTQANTTNGAFAAMAGPHISTTADQVHAAGEVWSSALWEVRARFVTRLGFATGNTKTMQLVIDGMKGAPAGPTFLQERDAILAAAQASAAAPEAAIDAADVWEGFRIRGMGFSASVQNAGTGSGNARVTESFDSPNVSMVNPFSISDSTGDNDGVPEPGEPLILNVSVSNPTGSTINNVMASVAGGGSANYGNLTAGQTVSMPINYTVSAGAPCGSQVTVAITVSSSIGSQAPVNRSFTLGTPNAGITENFDGVTAPALPAGWTNAQTSGTLINWATTATAPDSAPNSVFSNDPAGVNAATLTSPTFPIASAAAKLKYRHKFATEASTTPGVGFDGVVLDIKIGAGAFTDIVTAGGSFVSQPYNTTISTGFSSPIAGRQAWSGASGGFQDVEITLPAAASGQNVQLRWTMASDSSVAATGHNIDNVQVINSYTCSFNAVPKSRADFDGDGKSDVSVFRPSDGTWYVDRSTSGFFAVKFGLSADQLIPGDYDGDGKTDTAVYRPDLTPGAADLYILNSNGFTFTAFAWGVPNDVPVFADYDGDGKTDYGVFRPSDNTWYIFKSNGSGNFFTTFGQAGDKPVVGDFDGDGKADLTVFRGAGQWHTIKSSGGTSSDTFGLATDTLVPADYDGDNKDDLAVYRNGTWFIKNSTNGTVVGIPFGNASDVPVPGDYDGDGKDDQAVYRNGTWYMNRSTSGFGTAVFGLATDKPVAKAYIPQ